MDDLILLLENKKIGVLDCILGKPHIFTTSDVLVNQINMSGIKNHIPELKDNMGPIEQLRLIVAFLEEEEMRSVTDEYRPMILGFRKYLKQLTVLEKNFIPDEFINAARTSSMITDCAMKINK